AWKNQSDVPRRKIMRSYHLVDMASSRSQRKNGRRNQRSESEWQARLECNYASNADTETRKPDFCLKRAVCPADKLRRHITEENMENEVDQIAYADGEKHVVRKKCFGNGACSQRPGLA